MNDLDYSSIGTRYSTLDTETKNSHKKAIISGKSCSESVRNLILFLFNDDNLSKQDYIRIWKSLNFASKGIESRRNIVKKIEFEETKYLDSQALLIKEKCLEEKYTDSQNELNEIKSILTKSEQKNMQLRFELSQLSDKYTNIKNENKKIFSERNDFELRFSTKKLEFDCLVNQHNDLKERFRLSTEDFKHRLLSNAENFKERVQDKIQIINNLQSMLDLYKKKM